MRLTASSPSSATLAEQADLPEFEIRPHTGWVPVDFKELYRYRELLYFLIWRDVKVRYKQTVLGFAWAILQPVITVIISTIIFGNMVNMGDKMPDELKARHLPYCVFVYAGLLAWLFFSSSVTTGGTSLINAQNLLTKIYFPRLFVPAAAIGTALVDTLISFVVFFVIMAFYRIMPPWTAVFVPLLLLLTTLAALGVSFTLSALTITYRDFRIVIPFMITAWTMISPANYPLHSLHHPWINWLLCFNPMFGVISAYRSALLGEHWNLPALGIAIFEIAAMLIFGLYYFKKTERRFADIA